jgi:hypothetical protein
MFAPCSQHGLVLDRLDVFRQANAILSKFSKVHRLHAQLPLRGRVTLDRRPPATNPSLNLINLLADQFTFV